MPAINHKIRWSVLTLIMGVMLLLGIVACQKDPIDDDPSLLLDFSQDTVLFYGVSQLR